MYRPSVKTTLYQNGRWTNHWRLPEAVVWM